MLVNQTVWPTRRFVGILVATGAVIMTAGVLFGRYVVPASGSTGTRERPVPRAGAQPSVGAHPTTGASGAATPVVVPRPGESKATTPPAQAAGLLPGTPTRVNEFGIPVGYPHSEAGAISACGNYVNAYVDRRNRDASQIKKIFNAISFPEVADKLAERIISADSTTAKNFGLTSVNSPQMSFNIRPAGYSVQSASTNQAVVSVWSTAGVGIYSDGGKLAPQQSWGTDICTVIWQDGDWKLSDAGDGPNSPSITDRSAEAFERFIYVGRPAE